MAPGTLHLPGHRVGMALPILAGREEGETVGLEVDVEPMSCCACPVKLLGDSGGGGDGNCSNVAVRMTKLTFPPTDVFW